MAPLDPLGPDPIVRFAFVSFPQDTNPVPGILDSDHQAVLDTLNNYFTSHSRGSFTFSGDSDVASINNMSQIFTPHSTGVDFDMSLGSDGLFWHEMVIRNVDCEPGCEIDFRIKSGIGAAVQTSGVYTIYHESCGISIQGGF